MATPKRQLQILLTVREITPPIWRRILVDSAISLVKLHKAIQILMEWYDYHLYEFTIDGIEFAPATDEDEFYGQQPKSPRKKLGTVFASVGDSILYSYDFGDGWEIDITLEGHTPATGMIPAVTCIGGQRSGPLEDSGGPYGYMEKLQTLRDPDDPDHDDIKAWVPVDFEPERMNIQLINEELANL